VKNVRIGLLLIACGSLAACDKTCTFTGTVNTTYNYAYTDENSDSHFGSVTTNESGSVEVQVPSDVDCGTVRYGQDKKPAMEESAA